MSFVQFQEEASQLPLTEQRKLIAFLIARQTEHDLSFRDTLAKKIDDHEPSHWVELDDLKQRFTTQ